MRNHSLCRLALLLGLSLASSPLFAASLTTPLSPNNGNRGVMFDLMVGANDLRITGFDIFTSTTNATVYELYLKSGTWVGSGTTSSAWTLMSSTTTAGNGLSTLGFIDTQDFTLSAYSTYAIYLTVTDALEGISYTDGTAVGLVLANNSDLVIYEGAGSTYPFGGTVSPRNFTGAIYYEMVPEPDTGAAVLFTGMLGFLGLRRRRALRQAEHRAAMAPIRG